MQLLAVGKVEGAVADGVGGTHTLPRTLRAEGELAFVAEGVTEIPTGEPLTLRFHGALTWVMYTPTSARVPIGDAPITVED